MKAAARNAIIILFYSLIVRTACAEEVMTWSDCLAEAKKNNPDLISAVETVNQQKAAKDITASGLWPQSWIQLRPCGMNELCCIIINHGV